MPTHYHFFVKQETDEYKIGKFIGDLTNCYTKSYNNKYNRTGVIFAGGNQSKLIADEKYFFQVFIYILNNPVQAGLAARVLDYEYSSAKDHFGIRRGNLIDLDKIQKYFQSQIETRDFIEPP
jgi:hypothetical protein